jgi:RNA polymerase sigma factor (sigma-70 family)
MNAISKAAPLGLSATAPWDAELVRVYHERYRDLVGLAYLITSRAAVAEEIVQDAFVAAHRSEVRIRDTYAYVRRAVVNRCYSWGRQAAKEREREQPPPAPAEMAPDEMWDALATLKDRQRVAIVLRFYEDLPDERIAEILGCRPATVRTAIHRGLRSLRRVIDR